MLPPPFTCARAWFAGFAMGCLSACGSLNYSVERVASWADTQASNLLPAAQVRRKRHYPVSSEAPLFVQGDDPVLVHALAHELNAYFSAVTALPAGEAGNGGGFALVIRALSAGAAQPGAVQQPVPDSQQPASRLLNIRITDRYSNATFDQINIDLHTRASSDTARGQRNIRRAFRQAAAMLAGQS